MWSERQAKRARLNEADEEADEADEAESVFCWSKGEGAWRQDPSPQNQIIEMFWPCMVAELYGGMTQDLRDGVII